MLSISMPPALSCHLTNAPPLKRSQLYYFSSEISGGRKATHGARMHVMIIIETWLMVQLKIKVSLLLFATCQTQALLSIGRRRPQSHAMRKSTRKNVG